MAILFWGACFSQVYRKIIITFTRSSRQKIGDVEKGLDVDPDFPFGSRLQLNVWRILQIAFGTAILVPIRIFLLSATVPFSLILAQLILRFGEKGNIENYSAEWQKRAVRWIALLGRIQLFIMSVKVIEEGVRASPEEAPVLVVAPHSTIIDGFFMLQHAQKGVGIPSPISRKENETAPLVGQLLRVTNPILVRRASANSKRETVEQIELRAKNPERYGQIMIFPEGTNSNRKSLLRFKPGAFIPGKPVQPVLLRFECWDTITWTFDGTNIKVLLFLTLCQLIIKMKVEYLPVYQPDDEEKKNANCYAENVRVKMAQSLGIPCSQLTYENGVLYELTLKLKLPTSLACFDYSQLVRRTGFGIRDFQRRMCEFRSLRCEKLNVITKESLHKKLFLPKSSHYTEEFMMMMTVDESDSVDFYDFCILFSRLVQPFLLQNTIENIFQCLNLSCGAFLAKEDYKQVVTEVFSGCEESEVTWAVEESWSKMSPNKKSTNTMISKTNFQNAIESQPIYILLFNIVSENPPRLLREKLRNLIQ